MNEQDKKFIRAAIEISKKMVNGENEPFTAVLVDSAGNIVAEGENQIMTDSDPSAHSEMVLIRKFCHDNKLLDLSGYTLYANGEPCAMCAALVGWTNVSRLVFAVPTPSLNEIKGPQAASFDLTAAQLLAHGSNTTEVVGPILEEEARPVFEEFFKNRAK